LVIQGIALLAWWRSRRTQWAPAERRAHHALAATTVILVLVSTQPLPVLLGQPLDIPDSPRGAAPDVIFVLGDGYQRAASSDDDVPTVLEITRAATAAAWWHESSRGIVVLSGRNGAADRPAAQLGTLGAHVLVRHGVPADRIRIDSLSSNTREHPRGALQLAYATSASRVGFVTSSWHLRRARREFSRAFASVQWRSADEHVLSFTWDGLIPDAGWLGDTSRAVKEMVGIFTYAIRGGATGSLAPQNTLP
jgi:uncharacterized SAM-binding protein YcdF (DUF218 family)